MDKKLILYGRLSDEDKRKTSDMSNSIMNQKALLNNYIKNHSEFADYEIIELYDDGYSGTNFNRPGIEKVFEMAKKQEIQCIIVKDFSRFGRNYIEVGKYLEQIFPFLNIRFISVNDSFDSKLKSAAGSLDVGFKNLIHDNYARITSKKVTEVKLLKAKMGQYTSSFTFFGYIKEGEKWIIDSVAADIVRRIFKMRLSGYKITEIACTLNSENAPTPMQRKIELGSKLNGKTQHMYWTRKKVSKILEDERYTGVNVYGKTKKKAPGTYERVYTSKSEWLKIPNVFEPIISKEDYERVQQMKEVHRPTTGNECCNLLSRKIRCGICGNTLSLKHGKYYCETQKYFSDALCSNIRIKKDDLYMAIHDIMKLEAELFLSSKDLHRRSNLSDKRKLKISIDKLQKIIDKKDSELFGLYEKYKSGKINVLEFINQKKILEEDVSEASKELIIHENQLRQLDEKEQMMKNSSIVTFEKCNKLNALNKELVDNLISEVIVYSADRIEVKWKYRDLLGNAADDEQLKIS